jgi:hypothetical protein
MPLTNTTTTTTFPPPNPHIHHTCKEPCKYGCCSSSNTTSSGNIEKAPSADANTFGKTTPPPTNKTLKQKTKPSYSKSVRSRHRNFKIREPDETGLRKEWRERERGNELHSYDSFGSYCKSRERARTLPHACQKKH